MTGGQKALDQTLAGCNNPGTSGDSQHPIYLMDGWVSRDGCAWGKRKGYAYRMGVGPESRYPGPVLT